MRLAIVLIVFTSVAMVAGDAAQEPEQLHVVLPRDAIRSIEQPTFEAGSRAKLNEREPVLGIVGEGEQRAYSTWQLDRHEIVNDVFESKPIAVTW
jgi:hypothetical protein